MPEPEETPAADPTVVDSDTIEAVEAGHQVAISRRIVASDDPDEKRRAFVEGLARFGRRFIVAVQYQDNATLTAELLDAMIRWTDGEAILGTEDEAERRALFLDLMIEAGQSGMERLRAQTLLKLPESSPVRDTNEARDSLLRAIGIARAQHDAASEVIAIGDLLTNELVDDAEAPNWVERGESLFAGIEPGVETLHFLVGLFRFQVFRAIDARDAGDDAAARTFAEQAHDTHGRMAAVPGTAEQLLRLDESLAVVLEFLDEAERAADVYARLRIHSDPAAPGIMRHASHEARLRLKLGQCERAASVLAPLVETFEDAYLTAVEPGRVAETGELLGKVATHLAFAHAGCGRWGDALVALERVNDLRLRYQAALRRDPEGGRLLELERSLHALARGVTPSAGGPTVDRERDWMGTRVSQQARVLEEYREEYRRTRPKLLRDVREPLSVRKIAAALAPGAAVLTITHSFLGTLVVGVLRDDVEEPSIRLLIPELDGPRLEPYYSDEKTGWGWALVPEVELPDPLRALDGLLAFLDRELGAVVAAALTAKKVRRIALLPHGLYGLTPLWALPSLRDLEVLVAPSAAHLVSSAGQARCALKRAVAVGDPTLDLPLSSVETSSARHHLARSGVSCEEILREAALEDSIAASVASVELFHFCGHGRADLDDPLRSSLLVHPDAERAPVDRIAGFHMAADGAIAWRETSDTTRSADVPGVGRLVESREPGSDLLERRLEYSDRGTLLAVFRGETRTRLAEMWTTGDMLVERTFERCELAFLSACGAGAGGLSGSHESQGLPAALLVAGVCTTVAPLWTVSDVATVLFVDHFYERLGAASGVFDVVRAVHEIQGEVRGLSRDAACARLAVLRDRSDDLEVQFELDREIGRLREASEHPFGHPYEWAAFHVLGRGDVLLPTKE